MMENSVSYWVVQFCFLVSNSEMHSLLISYALPNTKAFLLIPWELTINKPNSAQNDALCCNMSVKSSYHINY